MSSTPRSNATPGVQTAPATDWTPYYDAQSGRAVRPVLRQVLELRDPAVPGTAIDLGCGGGIETRYLLQNGWRVHAIDADPASAGRVRVGLSDTQLGRLSFRSARFEELADSPEGLPAADLVNACFSLPFCAPESFPALWAQICAALRPGAGFSGELFGPHDSWAGRPDMNFHSRAEVDELLGGLHVHSLIEDDRLGFSAFGRRHWHVFHIVARRSA
ncbi:class I SAM-dependent methyltransferase [Cryobacterium frigoriphilum]|uniref:Class I SAM-dependent methyltransferase n=1 Tax=Cryobacterium frigoriphilum TaxID=1259150 RepID=A0A4R9A7I5_9MICO|nr:class I SAM-dependent methyltransferase [Cryobacterium frigoriphilum]TFD53351.1 class I SAM-dependent methyltransferase [Cryobacterium frigoriphilum]